MHFGENQLSRSLIGLSPLPTVHPPGFQPWWVRSSTKSYPCFNLTMGRSPRFGSRTRDTRHHFRLAFATHTPHGLSTPRITDSQAHSSKGTPSPHKALTAYRHTVSGTISLPSRGTFHHSLTVLSTIGHQGVFRLTRWSWQIHTRFHEPRTTRAPTPPAYVTVRLHDSHALRSTIPNGSTPTTHTSPPPAENGRMSPTTPHTQPPPSITRTRFSHPPLSLATTHGISLPTGTEMFHFPAFPPPPYTRSDDGNQAQPQLGSPIRTPSDHSSLANSPRHIAGRNVLHQLLMPRHPPNAPHN